MEVYQNETGSLIHGDCLEVMKGIPDQSVDMVCCDLPYQVTACDWDLMLPMDDLWKAYRRICKPTAAIVLFGAEPFSSKVRLSNPEWYRYDYTWVKTKSSGFQNAHRQPMRKHENIMVFYAKQPVFHQQHLVELVKPVESGRKRLRNDEQHRLGVAGKEHKTTHTGWQTSVLEFPNPSGKGHLHPTQKPLPLIQYLIRMYSDEGSVVLDNTCGSGTTAVAAIREHRRWLCMEKDEKYYTIAKERIISETRQTKIVWDKPTK